MNDRQALLLAALANPDEDTPRLALADWLQEHGDENDIARAEFIRLQIEAAKLPKGAKRKALEARAKKLDTKHREAWLGPIESFGAHGDVSAYARGFVTWIFVATGDFLKKKWQQTLTDALKTVGVEELCFYTRTTRINDFANAEALRWVTRIQYPGATDAMLAALAGAPNLAHFSAMILEEAKFSDAGLREFARTTQMSRLRKLTLTTTGGGAQTKAKFTASGVLALLRSDRLPLLNALDVDGFPDQKFAADDLFTDPALAKLRELRLGNEVSVARVLACPHLANLELLELGKTTLTAAEAGALLASPTLAKLKTLWLGLSTRLGPATVKKLKARFGEELRIDYN
jgi:uncharacterized protein (TIGR02996 family)